MATTYGDSRHSLWGLGPLPDLPSTTHSAFAFVFARRCGNDKGGGPAGTTLHAKANANALAFTFVIAHEREARVGVGEGKDKGKGEG